MTDWYFAYGSNLWIDQVVGRTGWIPQGDDRPHIARLSNYRLVFNMQDGTGEVFANIMPGGDGVVGVVYRLTHEALERMDHYEQGYLRQRVHVSIRDGEVIEAVTYVAEPASVAHGGRPSVEYLRRIVRGAKHHGLPDVYVRNLEKHHDELLGLASIASASPPTESGPAAPCDLGRGESTPYNVIATSSSEGSF